MSVAEDASELLVLREEISQAIDYLKDVDQQVENLHDEVALHHLTQCSQWTLTVLNATLFVSNAIMF